MQVNPVIPNINSSYRNKNNKIKQTLLPPVWLSFKAWGISSKVSWPYDLNILFLTAHPLLESHQRSEWLNHTGFNYIRFSYFYMIKKPHIMIYSKTYFFVCHDKYFETVMERGLLILYSCSEKEHKGHEISNNNITFLVYIYNIKLQILQYIKTNLLVLLVKCMILLLKINQSCLGFMLSHQIWALTDFEKQSSRMVCLFHSN